MNKIGIFFGTDTGSTRLIAKTIFKKLGTEIADKPLNVNRVEVEDVLKYDRIIFGTPTYGQGKLPGRGTGMVSDSWAEVLPRFLQHDLSDKTIALYGLGDQEKYGETYLNAMGSLYLAFEDRGARIVGEWPTSGYEYTSSNAVIDGKFVGLALDQSNQRLLTEGRIDMWLDQLQSEW